MDQEEDKTMNEKNKKIVKNVGISILILLGIILVYIYWIVSNYRYID